MDTLARELRSAVNEITDLPEEDKITALEVATQLSSLVARLPVLSETERVDAEQDLRVLRSTLDSMAARHSLVVKQAINHRIKTFFDVALAKVFAIML